MDKLINKVAVVTGAARGIGAAITKALAAVLHGWHETWTHPAELRCYPQDILLKFSACHCLSAGRTKRVHVVRVA